jgi:hypothetical protein
MQGLSRAQSRGFTRRELLKGGALVVGFSILGPLSKAFGQATAHIDPYGNQDYLDPRQLDSWVAVRQDGTVLVSTGKVDLGTGIETALAQIASDELDVPFARVHMPDGRHGQTVDSGTYRGQQHTIQAAGQHLRQATAGRTCRAPHRWPAARLDSLSNACQWSTACSATRATHPNVCPTRSSVGGRKFNIAIPVTGQQGGLQWRRRVKPKIYTDYKVVGTSVETRGAARRS